MDVAEVKRKKENVEDEILQLIENFEEETKTNVEWVSLHKERCVGFISEPSYITLYCKL